MPIILSTTDPQSPIRRALPARSVRVPFGLLALQSLLYLLLFRNRSWVHDYWQFLGAPFAALALASLVTALHEFVRQHRPGAARVALALLLVAPMPTFAYRLDAFYRKPRILPEYIEVLAQLELLVPPRTPVMTSWRLPQYEESFGSYTNRWTIPQMTFYANRPLIHSDDLATIQANKPRCPAYICEIIPDPQAYQLADALSKRYETVSVGRHHLIVLLDRPK
jgi:hypothetical protein